jgi:hypothetical protein
MCGCLLPKKRKSTMKFNFKEAAKNAVPTLVGATGGAIAAKAVNKFLPNLDPRIRAGAKVLVGLVIPAVSKNRIAQAAGDGIVAVGAVELLEAFVPSLAGIGQSDTVGSIEEDFAVHGNYDAKVYGAEESGSSVAVV